MTDVTVNILLIITYVLLGIGAARLGPRDDLADQQTADMDGRVDRGAHAARLQELPEASGGADPDGPDWAAIAWAFFKVHPMEEQ